ncbi:MAG: ABC transporter ATP-binding protein [Candidatus Nanopelagicales bacterium]
MSSASVITATDVTKKYGDFTALAGVSIHVDAGECLAILGPNGAGKTTLTEILEGYRQRDGGQASVLGVDPSKPTGAWKAKLGIVLQNATDMADLTVSETIKHFARYYPNPADPDQVMTAVGLAEKADSRNGKLSGGQRRRLDVALGIIGNPEVLFLDEPTTGFDPEARREFWVLIDRLKSNGTTILLTTHYLDEAQYLADRVAVIARGRIVAQGAPDSIGHRGDAIVTWTEAGKEQSQSTTTPTAFVEELSARFAGEIPHLAIRRASLEDAYLELIAQDRQTNGGDAA